MKFPILQKFFHFYYDHLKFLNLSARCINSLVILVWKMRKWKFRFCDLCSQVN